MNCLLTQTIEAVTKLMQVQDKVNLEDDKELQGIFYCLLKCSLHERPRVRKKARNSMRRLISRQCSSNNSITKLTLGWILDQLACFPTCETKVVADVLTLLVCLWSSIANVSRSGAKKLFEGVLRVMSSGESSIVKIGLSFFVEVFQNATTVSDGDEQDELFAKLLVAVWELEPDTRNTECFTLWLRCILSGLVRIHQKLPDFDLTYLASSMEVSSPLWITYDGRTIAGIFEEYFPHLISETISKVHLEKCFRVLSRNLLTMPPNIFALQILESLLGSLTPDLYCSSAQDIFIQLIPLRNAQGVLSAMGKFIRAFGIEQIWSSVDPATRWLVILPLINENLHASNISFWKTEILPGMVVGARANVGWASLVGFCRNPKDPENFPAELIGKAIVEKPDVRLQALAALRQFVEWPQCKEISNKYCKNYLPILFNLYIKTKSKPLMERFKGHADAVGTAIQKYLEHCDEQFVNDLTVK